MIVVYSPYNTGDSLTLGFSFWGHKRIMVWRFRIQRTVHRPHNWHYNGEITCCLLKTRL